MPNHVSFAQTDRLEAESSQARSQVLQHGWNSTSYQILNEGFERWWSADRQALVGFVRAGKCALVAGAPICSKAALSDAIDEWEDYAQRQGLEVCYFGAESRLQNVLRHSAEHTQAHIGLNPEWSPGNLGENFKVFPSLRAQINRAVNKGVSVKLLEHRNTEKLIELQRLRDSWLSCHRLPKLGFTASPVSFGNLADRLIFVAEQAGQPVGYLVLTPVPVRNGWLTEQFVRSSDSPNGTVELMIKHAADFVKAAGATYLTLGAAPLAYHQSDSFHSGQPLHEMILRWMAKRSCNSYNFRGIYEFKAKFRPDQWQPIALIVKDTRLRTKHLRALTQAFAGMSPERVLASGVINELFPRDRQSLPLGPAR